MMQYATLVAGVVIVVAALWFSKPTPPSFHPCEVCGALAGNYCTHCGSEQLAETE